MPSRSRRASPVSDTAVPPDHGPVVTFMRSSQARHWRFSAKQIGEMRSQGNEAARRRLEGIWVRERSLLPVDGEPEASSSSSSEPISFTSVEEEQALIRYYLTRVHQLVKAFGLPEVVEATTITFIKRFYLRNTCMDHHPKNIMLTCLFLAAKSESNAVPLQHFSTKLAGKGASSSVIQEYFDTVQKLEFLVSQSLDFQFMVHGAHRALHGLMLDVQQTLQPPPQSHSIRSLVDPARQNLKQSRFTDAEFIYTPAQIALACLRLASDEGRQMVEDYLETKEAVAQKARLQAKQERESWRQRKNGKGGPAQKAHAESDDGDAWPLERSDEAIKQAPLGIAQDDIKRLLADVAGLVEEKRRTASEDVEAVKLIDKKLKMCQNPENVPMSRISHERERVKEETALGKRKSIKASKGDADPFGDDDDDDDDDGQANAKRPRTGGLFATELAKQQQQQQA